MSLVFEAILAAVAIGGSLAVYFKFIDKQLDNAMNRVFASWHTDAEELEEL